MGRLIGAALLVIVVGCLAALGYVMNARDSLEPFRALFVASDQSTPGNGDVTVTFMGNTNLLISDGTTHLMTDGWFTRPSTFAVALSTIEPDREAIASGLAKAGVTELAAVIPVHSHFDHAMDAPIVAEATGALLVGSESTLNIGRGLGFPEERMRLVVPDAPMQFGAFTVTLIRTAHFEFPNPEMKAAALEDPVIEAPLVPPVGALDYKEGGSYSIHIAHPKGSVLLQGSAGYVVGALDRVRADIVFLGVGGVAAQTEAYQEAYWEQVVRVVGPTKVFAVHWDSLTDPLEDEPVMPSVLWSDILDFQGAAGIAYARDRAEADGIEAGLLPMWEPVLLFSN